MQDYIPVAQFPAVRPLGYVRRWPDLQRVQVPEAPGPRQVGVRVASREDTPAGRSVVVVPVWFLPDLWGVAR
eukprot:5428439-Lingulodinium_polyedra.AAC.1